MIWIPENPLFDSRIREMLSRQAFMKHLGFEITRIEAGIVEGEMPFLPHLFQQFGILHGGVVLTVADIVAGFAVYTLVPGNKDVVTAEIKVSCLRPGRGTKLRAVGSVLKPGKSLSFAEAEVFCERDGKEFLITKASTTMAIIHPLAD